MDNLQAATNELRRRKIANALELYRSALDSGQDAARAMGGIALCSYYLGQYEEASTQSDEALMLDGGLALPHVVRAYLCAQGGKFSEALDEAETGANLEPNDPIALSVLGALLIDSGRLDDAEQAVHNAFRIDESYWYPQFLLSRISSLRGKHGEALRKAWNSYHLCPSVSPFTAALQELGMALRVPLSVLTSVLLFLGLALRSDLVLALGAVLPTLACVISVRRRNWGLFAITGVGLLAIIYVRFSFG